MSVHRRNLTQEQRAAIEECVAFWAPDRITSPTAQRSRSPRPEMAAEVVEAIEGGCTTVDLAALFERHGAGLVDRAEAMRSAHEVFEAAGLFLRENPIDKLRELVEDGGGWADETSRRRADELIGRIARLPGMQADPMKVTSLRGHIDKLYSARKHEKWGGPAALRSHIFVDLAGVEMIVPEPDRWVRVSCSHHDWLTESVPFNFCGADAEAERGGRPFCWRHAGAHR